MTSSFAVERLSNRWREFWFARIPPHAYALLRILTGLVGLLTLVGAWNPAFWDVNGLVPASGGWHIRPWLNAHGLASEFGLGLRALLLIGYACLTLGVISVVTAPAMFLGSAAMLWWNWLPYSSAQELLHLLILPLIFVNSGSVWSVDAWRRARSAPDAQAPLESIWPLRLLQYQVAIMYLSAALWKMGNPDWRGGLALHYVLNTAIYQRAPGVVPAVWFGVTVGLTYLTLAWELAFPFLIWFRRTRPLMLVLGVLLHLGMWVSIEVGAFTPTVLVSYVAFLDPWRIESRLRWPFKPRGAAPDAALANS
jgi:vitamin K-dependent gamma-carboxylase-like protein